MTLPVSSYEELLNRVKSITNETRQLQRQIDAPLLDLNENCNAGGDRLSNSEHTKEWESKARASCYSTPDPSAISCPPFSKDVVGSRWTKEQGASPEAKEQEETSSTLTNNDRGMKLISGSNSMCHSTSGVCVKQSLCGGDSGLSYSYSYSSEQLGTKVEMVYNLLSMLGTHDRAEMTSTLLAMSSSPDSCKAMRQSGCLSLLVQLVHSSGESTVVRQRAAQALRNMILSHGDDKRGRREARVLRLLEQVTAYCDELSTNEQHVEEGHPGPTIAALMKLSFDEEHRLAMCQLGALYVIARLVQAESPFNLEQCVTLKRYAGMALTNLTFGDGNNKALLCSMKPFMAALVAQLSSSSEDLTQVTASVLRNLSWRADASSKQALREVGSVPALMRAAMCATREPTLKSVLSALWNLSAHCNINKVDICGVDGALQFLIEILNYQSASKTLAVVENAGGILRNISSHVAVREDYRKILREHNCLAILLRQLQSGSLTVVSNACGTLWNLSARCATDQKALVALGAVPMLTSLAHSRHRMIAMGASAALKNLLPIRIAQQQAQTPSGSATLLARKRRALEAELINSLSETCDNIDPCPQWSSDTQDLTTSQTKDDCNEINRSVQQMTLEENTEQPVNYSLKYSENENKTTESGGNDAVNYGIKFNETASPEQKSFNSCFNSEDSAVGQSDYAETDLDQLTDFSLRYNEGEQNESHSADTVVSRPVNQLAKKSPEEEKLSNGPSVDASPGKIEPNKVLLETPLMFSRSSSLGSISSCEQQDDCRSSVVSEFSRMTSGIMSPSDLPDSPTQTVPPSPRVKNSPTVVTHIPAPAGTPVLVKQPANPTTTPSSRVGVFDDDVVAFKEESTPVQFSTATSLSDLTFDDEARNEENPLRFYTEDTPACLSHATSHSELSCALSDGSSDHDNILAECIQSGMPKPGDKKQIKAPHSPGESILAECIQSGMPKHGDRKPFKTPNASIQHSANAENQSSAGKSSLLPVPPVRLKQLVAEDEIAVFADEGSPRNFSIWSSLSDLTIDSKPERSRTPPAENPSPLSSLDPEDEVDTEGGTALSGNSAEDATLVDSDDQALLREVISSGMPPGASEKMKESLDDTWGEEPSFTSMSLTAPAVVRTYDSDEDSTLAVSEGPDGGIIPLEGGKGVALISNLSLEDSNGYLPLDQVQPPSNVASVISLSSSIDQSLERRPEDQGGDMTLLENVQPPSGVESILELSMAGGDSLLEDAQPPVHADDANDLDISILSVASLPHEDQDDATLTLLTPPPSKRQLTPKQRRDVANQRYNTYVISKKKDDLNGSSENGHMEPDEFEEKIVKERRTPKQRRQADRERFMTRTIHDGPTTLDRLSSVESESASGEPGVLISSTSGSSGSDGEEPPRPIVTKPVEVKSIRGGARGSSIPIHRSPAKVPSAVPMKKSGPSSTSPLQRQGTFTKDEPSSVITRATATSPSQPAGSSIPVFVKGKIPSPLKSTSSTGGGRGRAASLPNKAAGLGVRTSLSNHSLKSACQTSSGDQASKQSQSAEGRWHSNSSLNSGSGGSGSGGGGGAATGKKEAASKIAGLWKKVDESKKKQLHSTKDSRQWIGPESKSKQVA